MTLHTFVSSFSNIGKFPFEIPCLEPVRTIAAVADYVIKDLNSS